MNKKIAIVSNLVKGNNQDFSYYDEVIIDLWDRKTHSVKHVTLYFVSGNYEIGDLVSYDDDFNYINRDFTKIPDYEFFSLMSMREKYQESLINILKNDIEIIRNKDIDRAPLSFVKLYVSISEMKKNKLNLLIGNLDRTIELIGNKYFNDNNNNFTKKRK